MDSNTSQSVIAAEMEITGMIKTSGSIQIHGKLEGDLRADGDATIGKGAVIKGNLTVSSVSIAGTINGNITAKDRIQMLATARVMGDIKAKRLSVEDGVTFVGRSEVNPSGAAVGGAADNAGDKSDEPKPGLFGKR